MDYKRGQWGSNFGFLMAAVGSAVGLGNIVGFPYKSLEAPSNFVQTDSLLAWSHPTAERFTLYTYPRGIELEDVISNPKYLK
ncbi:MAG: hypothetical protein IIU67_06745, partial [Lachnospiraceae bacterium]|nr:hypothetical protein [Lachnospiraceae bacterium]